MAEETTAPAAAPRGPGKHGQDSSQVTVSDMIPASIAALNESNGSSFQAIKRYMAATYNADVESLSPFIRHCLKNAVTRGAVVQTKGKGSRGFFKLPNNVAAPEGKTPGKNSRFKAGAAGSAPKKSSPKKPKAAEVKKPKKSAVNK